MLPTISQIASAAGRNRPGAGLLNVDAWGRARVEIMDERHATEHEELRAAFLVPSVDPGRVGPLLDRLLQHMGREEHAFLGEDVLRDDSVVIDAFGG